MQTVLALEEALRMRLQHELWALLQDGESEGCVVPRHTQRTHEEGPDARGWRNDDWIAAAAAAGEPTRGLYRPLSLARVPMEGEVFAISSACTR